jgi:thioredoxin 2
MVAPELRKVATETGGRLVVAKVNTEDMPTLGYRYHVSAIPTMTLFQNGIEVARQAGAMPASQIRQFIEQHT